MALLQGARAVSRLTPNFTAMELVLTTTRHDLIALYKKRGTIDLWRSPAARTHRQVALYMAAASIVLFFAAAIWSSLEWMAVWGAFMLGGAVFLIAFAGFYVLRHRAQVIRWARLAEKEGPATVTVKDQGLDIRYAGQEIIVPWASVSSAQIFDDHLILWGKHEMLFPRSSMTAEQFDKLARLVREKTLEQPTRAGT